MNKFVALVSLLVAIIGVVYTVANFYQGDNDEKITHTFSNNNVTQSPTIILNVVDKAESLKEMEIPPENSSLSIPQKTMKENTTNDRILVDRSRDLKNSNIYFPCTGKIDQISGVSMNHVHIAPSADSPSKPPVEGGGKIKIGNSIYRDSKGWFEISYNINKQTIHGWIPAIYVLPFSDCYDK